MRVLFDGFWWVKGPTANRTVMREMIFAWQRTFPHDQLIVAIRSQHRPQADVPDGVDVVTTRLTPQAISNALELPWLARQLAVDAMMTHNYTPLLGKSLVFIHDILFEEHPEWFSKKERVYFAPMAPLARRATVVATSSRAEARRISTRHPGLTPVLAVGLAASPHLVDADPIKPAGLSEVARFVLSVGRLNRRKNLGTVIEGAMRAESVTPLRPLVVVGSSEYSGAGADLPSSIQEHVASGRLIFLGRISDGELRWMYEQADCLIFLSLDEGFGLPPIEAMHFGAPVLVSDIPVMREVVGEKGTFISPTSPLEVSVALDRMARTDTRPLATPRDVTQDWNEIVRALREQLYTTLRRRSK